MKLELLTKDDLGQMENKLEQLVELLQSAPGEYKIFNTQELADHLQVSTKTIQNWRQNRLIEYSQIGSKIFYTQKAVSELLSKHSIKRFHKF
jgi:hypothetical protein